MATNTNVYETKSQLQLYGGLSCSTLVLDFLFFPVFAIYLYLNISVFYFYRLLLDEQYIGSQEQEPAELLSTLGFLLFVAINMYKQSSRKG